MKKFLTALTLTLAIFACCLIAACGEKGVKPVVIKTDDTAFEYSDKTLKDYMDYLQDDGKLSALNEDCLSQTPFRFYGALFSASFLRL